MKIVGAGEKVTCENGHYICSVAKDIDDFDVFDVGQFEDWQGGNKPEKGSVLKGCDKCGAPFVDPYGKRKIHTASGWLPGV